jgi:DNA-directed RNA polymerase specialized sigma24 family protein
MRDEELARVHVGVIVRDPDALAAFESAVRPLVRGMLRNMRLAAEDTDEIWNDAFLVTVEMAPTVEPLGVGLRRLALTVAHRRAVDRIRQHVRFPRTSIEEAEGRRDAGSPLAIHETKASAVRRCIDQARPLHAAVMEMASRGLTAREISLVLNITEANAAKVRQRARAWFAECLKGVIPDE